MRVVQSMGGRGAGFTGWSMMVVLFLWERRWVMIVVVWEEWGSLGITIIPTEGG